MRGAPKLLDRLAPEDAEHFDRVREMLDDAGLRYELEPTLVRGLDYYARTVFEFTSDALGAAQSTVGAGGRYDGLIEQLGGQPTPASGWAAGVERILLAAPEQPIAPPNGRPVRGDRGARTPGGPRSIWPAEARRAGLSAQLELTGRSLKGQLKQADRLGARYVALVGSDSHVAPQAHGVRRADRARAGRGDSRPSCGGAGFHERGHERTAPDRTATATPGPGSWTLRARAPRLGWPAGSTAAVTTAG